MATGWTNLSEEFAINTTLLLLSSPAMATGAGLHKYQGRNLDDQLDDLSPASLDKQRMYYEDFQKRLGQLNASKLAAEDRADLSMLQNQTAANLMELLEIRTPFHNPTLYVETLGNALFNCYVLEYAPKPARLQNIISRLQSVPLFLDQAATNLTDSTDVWT